MADQKSLEPKDTFLRCTKAALRNHLRHGELQNHIFAKMMSQALMTPKGAKG